MVGNMVHISTRYVPRTKQRSPPQCRGLILSHPGSPPSRVQHHFSIFIIAPVCPRRTHQPTGATSSCSNRRHASAFATSPATKTRMRDTGLNRRRDASAFATISSCWGQPLIVHYSCTLKGGIFQGIFLASDPLCSSEKVPGKQAGHFQGRVPACSTLRAFLVLM